MEATFSTLKWRRTMATNPQRMWRLFAVKDDMIIQSDRMGRFLYGDIAYFLRDWDSVLAQSDLSYPGYEVELRDPDQRWAIRIDVNGIGLIRSLTGGPELDWVEIEHKYGLKMAALGLNTDLKQITWIGVDDELMGKGELDFRISQADRNWRTVFTDGIEVGEANLIQPNPPDIIDRVKLNASQINHEFRVLGAETFWKRVNGPSLS